ncbi:DUF1488 domain-containing protein [Variovorax paradoxus]|uniref:DUF1488 domain-containing protein n=1 Tax=Variovorax paradoxus TaxID=34073 RepID=UPI0021ABEF44|nr:DUF1488 domain-containing protein [Variovorax paradoxus]UVH54718.1 DUF1488 domain-containing protein [Variovorax paradoxus]
MTNAINLKDSHLIEFSVYSGGQRIICFIRYEALKDHLGATSGSVVDVLEANRGCIDPVAIRVANRTPDGGHVIVETSDL